MMMTFATLMLCIHTFFYFFSISLASVPTLSDSFPPDTPPPLSSFDPSPLFFFFLNLRSLGVPLVAALLCPGPVSTPFRTDATSVVAMFLGGQHTGSAMASVLFGDSVPAAKLPITFPAQVTTTTTTTTTHIYLTPNMAFVDDDYTHTKKSKIRSFIVLKCQILFP
jgi:hypothetical protein